MSAADVVTGHKALAGAVPGYADAANYYEGKVGEVFASRLLRRALGRGGDKFKINLAKTPVNAVAERLEIVSWQCPDDDAANTRLQEIVEANDLRFEAPNVHLRVSEYGDAYVLVWPSDDDPDGKTPVINYLPPHECRVIYDRDNPRKKLFAVHAWTVGKGQDATYRADLFYPDRVEKWVTGRGQKPEDEASWQRWVDEEDGEDGDGVIPNPYGVIPVFHFRNMTPYGKPEHYDAYGPQDAFTKIVVSHMASVDFVTAPQRYALEDAGGGDDDFDLDDDLDFGDEEQTDPNSTTRGLRWGPGTIPFLKGVKAVGEFKSADPDAYLKPARFYAWTMSQTTVTPFHMFDDSGDEPSGESRRRKEAPLTRKVDDRARRYKATWEELASFALRVAGLDDRAVVVTYAPAEVVSDKDGWATIKAKIEAGVPVRVALMESGYSKDAVDEWFPEGDENQLRVVDLAAVASLLKDLGAAVALDIITAEEARAMLPEGIVEGSGDSVTSEG